MRIVGYHISSGIIANSDGKVTTEHPYLDFLLQDKPDTIRMFYHMGHSLANLFKLINLTRREGERLQTYNKLYITPYSLKHAANKFLSIKKGFQRDNPFAFFGDANQYKPAKLDESDTVESCLAKAKEAQQTGEEVYNALCSVGLHPITLTSPIRVYEREILSKMNLPTIDDIPEEAGYYAYQCCTGNWLEAFQMGYWKMAWSYDINSAYPAELSQLLDLRLGKWIKSNYFVGKAAYGYCKGIVTITAPFSPIIYRGEGADLTSLNYTPVGIWETYLTKKAIEFIYRQKLGSFELESGWWWIPTKQERLLKSITEQLYLQKEQATGLSREIVKRIMAGIWGKFLQVKGEDFGEMFNSVYGAEVETNVKLSVAEFALQHKIMPIHIAVDGLITDREVVPNILTERETRIGNWRQSGAAPCVVAGTAVVAIEGEEKEGTGDFSLSYNWLMEQIRQHPEAKEYKTSKLSPVTLAVALNEDKWEELGQLREITRVVDIGNELKRCYKEKPKSGQELLSKQYQSLPWDTSIIG